MTQSKSEIEYCGGKSCREDRKDYIDYVKAIGIILVVLGHINFANGGIKAWIYAFHMPVFFLASGLTMKKRKITWRLISDRIKSLLVPYFIYQKCIFNGRGGFTPVCVLCSSAFGELFLVD